MSVDQRAVHALDARRELRLTRVVVGLTIIATLLPAAGALLDLADSLCALAWGHSLTALLFLAVLGTLAYGVFVYHLTRLGHLTRTLAHRPASDDELARLHDPTSPSITILVPSYREDAAVVRKTLLSAALQDYPRCRLVLLIDDPPDPAQLPDARGLVACRRLPHEVAELLSAPGAWAEAGLCAILDRPPSTATDLALACRRLAGLYRALAAWLETQASEHPMVDHTDALFVELTFTERARRFRDHGERWAMRAATDAARVETAVLWREHERLAALFRLDIESFERKRYTNLSHEPNKAMNLNAYLGLMGCSFREIRDGAHTRLVPCGPDDADLVVPDTEFVLVVDADTVLAPDYAVRMMHLMRKPGHERLAVAQTPYCTFPGAPAGVQRTAGATTDIQYLIHQGLARYGATFWVGANALVRMSALRDIATTGRERGHPVRKFIQDRTVIEDTESTIDLVAKGWTLLSYPERLAFSATPGDFGSLLVQRRRWANGGVLLLPGLMRALRRRDRRRAGEGPMRLHYLVSLGPMSLVLLVLPLCFVEDVARASWLFLVTLSYLGLYARDLVAIGYRWHESFRVYALNLLLIPVNLAGLMRSLHQVWSGRKAPFGRTPKAADRTPVPCAYVVAEFVVLMLWGVVALNIFLDDYPLAALLVLVHAGFLAYALGAFVGWRASAGDVLRAVRHRRHAPVPAEAWPLSAVERDC